MKKKIFIIAGEKSGDLLGSKILQNVDKNIFDIEGIGGDLMLKSGLEKSLFPMTELSLMGVFEVVPKIFNLIKRIKETANYILKTKPDLVLTIDSPDFCFRVMKLVKKRDKDNTIKKVHFIAPSVWAYRKKRAQKIANIYDLLFCILPFEPPYFEKYGLKTIFVGHPIFDKSSIEYDFNNKENIYNPDSNIISITLGSRESEVKRFFPIIMNVINKIEGDYKYYILATENTYDFIKQKLDNNDKIFVIKENKNEIIKKSLLVIAKSGTNTLEAAGFSIPMVVYYKFGFLTNIIVKMLKKDNQYATIINIINKQEIIPECLLDDCNSQNILNTVNSMINSKESRKKQIEKNIDTLKLLGYHNNNNSAEIIVKTIEDLCQKK